jgi:hypothetical protein
MVNFVDVRFVKLVNARFAILRVEHTLYCRTEGASVGSTPLGFNFTPGVQS